MGIRCCKQARNITYTISKFTKVPLFQDGRLVDLPLSYSLLKLISSAAFSSASNDELLDYRCVLDLADLEAIHPVKGRFLRQLATFSNKKEVLMAEGNREMLDKLMLELAEGGDCRVEDLGLTFQLNPTSRVSSACFFQLSATVFTSLSISKKWLLLEKMEPITL